MTGDSLACLKECLRSRYEVTQELERHKVANRYLAHDLNRERAVSISVLNARVSDWVGSDVFLQELMPYVGVDHPQLATVVDGGVIDGCAFWVSL